MGTLVSALDNDLLSAVFKEENINLENLCLLSPHRNVYEIILMKVCVLWWGMWEEGLRKGLF